MTGPWHPNVARMQQDTAPLLEVLAVEERRLREESYVFSDDTGTVTVEVNGYLWLTGLDIADGTLRLGAEVVQDRINAALRSAADVVPSFIDAHVGRVADQLGSMIEALPGASNQPAHTRIASRDADGASNW